jgi:hypothetical protein
VYLPANKTDIQSSNNLFYSTQYSLLIPEQTSQSIPYEIYTLYNISFYVLTLISSKSKLFRIILFLFQMMGGLKAPWTAQLRTALCPTVVAVMLIL